MANTERRRGARTDARLLVSYRAEDATPTPAGFVSSLNLSEKGMLLESPDSFQLGHVLAFEILLDYDHAAHIQGQIVRIDKAKRGLNHIAIEFQSVPPHVKELLRAQSLG